MVQPKIIVIILKELERRRFPTDYVDPYFSSTISDIVFAVLGMG